MRRDLAEATGLELPPTLVFDYPSMQELVDFLLQQLPPPSCQASTCCSACCESSTSSRPLRQ